MRILYLFGYFLLVCSWQIYIESLLAKCLTLRFQGSYLEKLEACFIVRSGDRHCRRVLNPQVNVTEIVRYPYICGWMVPTTSTTKHYFFRYDVVVYEAFVVKIRILNFNIDYSPSCRSQYLQIQSCNNDEKTTIYCGHRMPWNHQSRNNTIYMITSGLFEKGLTLYRAYFEIVDRKYSVCSPVELLYIVLRITKLYDFTMNELTSSQSQHTNTLYYQIRTDPYRRITFIVGQYIFNGSYNFYDGPGIKSPLIYSSDIMSTNVNSKDMNLNRQMMTSSFQLFITNNDKDKSRKSPFFIVKYKVDILGLDDGNCWKWKQLQSTSYLHNEVTLPRQNSTLCSLFLYPLAARRAHIMSCNVSIDYFKFSGRDIQYSDMYELCPMGGQYIYRSQSKNVNDLSLVHDGCHTDKSYSINLIIDSLFIIHIAFPGYSSLKILSNIQITNCRVYLNPCFSQITRIMMAPDMCVSILETPLYSSSHLPPNKCSYNLSYAEVMTGSATMYVTFLYPNFKPQICINNSNRECGLYTHKAYFTQDWPEKNNVVQDIFTSKGGSFNSSIHFQSLKFVEIIYRWDDLYSRNALFSLYMTKKELCRILPDGDVHIHAIFISTDTLSLCSDLSKLKLPNKFNTVSLRLETIQNKNIVHHIQKILTNHQLKIDPSHTTADAISISIYYDKCPLSCVNDTVRVTEYDDVTTSMLTHVWYPSTSNDMWLFQNLISVSGIKIKITRHISKKCGFKLSCSPYLQQDRLKTSPLVVGINITKHLKHVNGDRYIYDDRFSIFTNR